MTRNHLPLLVSIVVAFGCSSKESGPTKETPEENPPGSAQSEADTAKEDIAPAIPAHPDLVQICASAGKKLAEGLGQDTRLLQWGDALVLRDPQVKSFFEGIEGSSFQHRYVLVQQIAKESGHPDWHCPDLQALYSLAGQN